MKRKTKPTRKRHTEQDQVLEQAALHRDRVSLAAGARRHDESTDFAASIQAGEAVPPGTAELLTTENFVKETLERPDEIALNASYARTKLAADADVLEMAVDAADSVNAGNSLEKMLAHQMAAAHDLAMKLFYLSTQADLPPLEIPRLANAAARLMEVFQDGLLALHRARGAAKQTIVVQHVQVTGQGQAVVAGALERTTRQEGVPEKR